MDSETYFWQFYGSHLVVRQLSGRFEAVIRLMLNCHESLIFVTHCSVFGINSLFSLVGEFFADFPNFTVFDEAF